MSTLTIPCPTCNGAGDFTVDLNVRLELADEPAETPSDKPEPAAPTADDDPPKPSRKRRPGLAERILELLEGRPNSWMNIVYITGRLPDDSPSSIRRLLRLHELEGRIHSRKDPKWSSSSSPTAPKQYQWPQ